MDYSISISRSATPFAADRDGALVSQEHICDSRKFVSKHVYPVTGPDPPMCEVGACLL